MNADKNKHLPIEICVHPRSSAANLVFVL